MGAPGTSSSPLAPRALPRSPDARGRDDAGLSQRPPPPPVAPAPPRLASSAVGARAQGRVHPSCVPAAAPTSHNAPVGPMDRWTVGRGGRCAEAQTDAGPPPTCATATYGDLSCVVSATEQTLRFRGSRARATAHSGQRMTQVAGHAHSRATASIPVGRQTCTVAKTRMHAVGPERVAVPREFRCACAERSSRAVKDEQSREDLL
jgi:hypothetical protein